MLRGRWLLVLAVVAIAIPLASCGRRPRPEGEEHRPGPMRPRARRPGPRARGEGHRPGPRGPHLRRPGPGDEEHRPGPRGSRPPPPHRRAGARGPDMRPRPRPRGRPEGRPDGTRREFRGMNRTLPAGYSKRRPGGKLARQLRMNMTRNSSKDSSCTRYLHKLKLGAKSILRPDYGFDSVFSRLVHSPSKATPDIIRSLATSFLLKKCNAVDKYLTQAEVCKKKTSSIRLHLARKYAHLRKILGHSARQYGVYNVSHLCTCHGNADRSPDHSGLRVVGYECHVSWRVLLKCQHYFALQCAARKANLSLDYSEIIWSNSSISAGAGKLEKKPKGRRPHHRLPELPSFVEQDHPSWGQPRGKGKKLRPPPRDSIRQGRKGPRKDGESLEDLPEDAEHARSKKASGIVALQAVMAIAIAGFVVILVLYVRSRRRRRVVSLSKHGGSCSSVSTTITDTGEYYAKQSPLDVVPDESWSAGSPSEKEEIKKIMNHGWHNPVYIVQEEAGADTGLESEL